MFSVMWSEHCSYKSSRAAAADAARPRGEGVIAGPGENAGVISIGDGLAVAFKIESHNHPSAVEPYQGAATGVGGILRDIFTMGARPIAVLDALRFGDPGDARTRHLVDGVVKGVGGTATASACRRSAASWCSTPRYAGNPLVNVMAIGLLEDGMLSRARAAARATSSSCSAPRPAATGSAARRVLAWPRSAMTTRRSARASRWATRSPRSC